VIKKWRKKKELTKDEKIKKEFNRLKRVFKDMPKDRKDTAMSLDPQRGVYDSHAR